MRNFVEEILSKYISDCVQHRATILYECFSRKKPSLFKRNNVHVFVVDITREGTLRFLKKIHF